MLCLPDGWPTRILPSPPRQGHGEEGGRARRYYFTQALKRPIHPWGQQWPCLQNFCSQEMWGWGGTSLGSVSCSVVTAGALQGRTPVCTGSPCWWRGKGSAHGSPGLSPPRAGLEPGLVPKSLLSSGGYQRGGKASVGLPKAHSGWQGPLGHPSVPSHPQGQHSWGQRQQWGDPALPALLSQPTAGMQP